jgi:predicted small metal-binding protein
MTKVIHCRDLGFDCTGVIRAKSEEEALQMAAEHAKAVHGMDRVSPEVVAKLKAVIREEAEKPTPGT